VLICSHADVEMVLRDKRFSRAQAHDVDDVDLSGTILGLDGNEHAAVRGVVKDWFTPAAVERLRGKVEEQAEAQLRVMVDLGEAADLVADFALPYALHIICDMLGLPQDDRLQFREWGDAFLGNSPLTRTESEASALAMAQYLGGQIMGRRQAPVDERPEDLLSQIADLAAELPIDWQIKLPIALVIGGWETAASSIAKFVWVLQTIPYAEHETAWNYLVSHPELIESAVTELERLYSTTSADDMPRRVMAAVTLPGGMELQPGQVVIPSHDAANRDPKVFDAPDRIDFGRSPNPHLSFGYGAHHCIGRYLGHMEVVTAIKVLTQEMPDLRLAVPADQIPFKPGHTINGPVELPVTWT
jgi:cytochrome P450